MPLSSRASFGTKSLKQIFFAKDLICAHAHQLQRTRRGIFLPPTATAVIGDTYLLCRLRAARSRQSPPLASTLCRLRSTRYVDEVPRRMPSWHSVGVDSLTYGRQRMPTAAHTSVRAHFRVHRCSYRLNNPTTTHRLLRRESRG